MCPSSHKYLIPILLLLILHIQTIKIHLQTGSTVTYDSLKSLLGQKINYKYYDNLNSPNLNYYYGPMTKQAYEMSIKLYKMDNYQQCSQLTPFATKDMQSCLVCPQDKPVFNLGTRQCEYCKPQLTQKCDQILNIGRSSASSINNQTSSTAPSSTVNTSSTTVPKNTTTSTSTTSTTSNTSKTTTTPTKSPTSSKSTTSTTSSSTSSGSPYVVVWQPNRQKKQNTSTANTSVTSNQDYVLEPVPIGQNGENIIPHQNYTYVDYRVVDNTTSRNATNTTNNKTLIAQSFGDNNTFSNKQCPSNQPYYNPSTKTCQACKTGQQYVPLQKKCLPLVYISNFKYKNVILQKPDQLLVANAQIAKANPIRTVVVCPIEQPIVINNTCKGCQSTLLLWNFTKRGCQQSCPEGLIFSSANSKCITATYLTNSDSPNLLSPLRDFDEWRSGQKAKVKSSSDIVQCPITKPIMLQGKCSNCPGDKPLFNIQSRVCQSCTRNRVYNQVVRKCISEFNSGLQVKKMIPNII